MRGAPDESNEVACRVVDLAACVDAIVERAGPRLVVGAPLGIGKPNQLLNALYQRVAADTSLDLTLVTALSLGRPVPRSDLERRFLEPFSERHFADYPELDYLRDLRQESLPANIHVSEFYFLSGQFLGNADAQRAYVSSNYTHVARDMIDKGINVVLQLVARRETDAGTQYSLSSNPDVTLDVVDLARSRSDRPLLVVGQVNARMPFMHGDALVGPAFFDLIVDERRLDFEPFAPPREAIDTAEHLIGLAASGLMRDGGTLQVGIGSLGDAFVHACLLRHERNAVWQRALNETGIGAQAGDLIERWGGTGPFAAGLYGASEMFMDGFLQLYRHGILKRRVYEHEAIQAALNEGSLSEQVSPAWLQYLASRNAIGSPLTERDVAFLKAFGIFREDVALVDGRLSLADGSCVVASLDDAAACSAIAQHCLGRALRGGALMHAAFFLGSRDFYDALRKLDDVQHQDFCMTRVSKVNQLYGDEALGRLQRRHARFINSAMKMTLLGAAVSDGLENGQVVSGVGGQYNFVAMAHALPGGRSILMIRSTRGMGRDLQSNVVWNYGHATIPRHLRDIVISEYGIADLRGRTDEECIAAMLNIADARFQGSLLAEAQRAGKISATYRIPERFADNRPEALEKRLAPFRQQGLFEAFPFGCDFSDEELALASALQGLRVDAGSASGKLRIAWQAIRGGAPSRQAEAALARLGLDDPRGLRQSLLRRLLVRRLAK